jgi:aminocarboxymuconate-semialdehyde decarboxylase
VKVDIHSHFFPDAYVDALRETGNPYGLHVERGAAPNAPDLDAVLSPDGSAYELPPESRDPDAKIRELDRFGFDLAIVSPGVTVVHYELEGDEIERHVRRVNDSMAEIQRAYADRLRVMGILPMQDPEAAVRELDRLAAAGIGAAIVCTNVLGANLDEPRFRPVFARAAELGTLLFVHAWFVAGRERLTRYHLINAVGNPFDVTIAVASILFSGMLDEFPALKLCFAHAGGAAPFIVGRLDRAYQIRPEARGTIDAPPSSYLDRLFFDTIVHSDLALQYLVDLVGPSQLLAGTDCPYHKTDYGDPRPLARIDSLRIDAEAKRRIAGGNAAEMLGLL